MILIILVSIVVPFLVIGPKNRTGKSNKINEKGKRKGKEIKRNVGFISKDEVESLIGD